MARGTGSQLHTPYRRESLASSDWQLWGAYAEADKDYSVKCECLDICRCRKLTNPRIYELDHLKMISSWVSQDKAREKLAQNNPQYLYGVDRAFATQRINKNDFHIEIKKGYYGEEISKVTLAYDKAVDLETNLNSLQGQTNDELVRSALVFEYGYLLDELTQAKFSVQEVSWNNLYFGAREHYHNLDQEIVDRYKDQFSDKTIYADKKTMTALSKMPRGVVKPSGVGFRVIDGYHRLSASEGEDKVRVIIAN